MSDHLASARDALTALETPMPVYQAIQLIVELKPHLAALVREVEASREANNGASRLHG